MKYAFFQALLGWGGRLRLLSKGQLNWVVNSGAYFLTFLVIGRQKKTGALNRVLGDDFLRSSTRILHNLLGLDSAGIGAAVKRFLGT